MPQGSVFGPLLFILYTGELEQIINSHGLLAYSHLIPRAAIHLNGVDIAPSRSVKLLGMHIDDHLLLSTQISKTVRSGFF